MLKFNYKNSGIEDLTSIEKEVNEAFKTLVEKKGPGKEFTEWVELPRDYDKDEFARIKKAAEKIRKQSDVLISIGIGGSYLGARAVIDALSPSLGKRDLEVIFAGRDISPIELNEVIEYIDSKDFSINVISKSGTTTEPAIAFRILKEILEKKYGEKEAVDRIYVTTDKKKGALKTLADKVGYETFVVPDAVGGRYSVLTAVGLLPIAAAGLDIDALMRGARSSMEEYADFDIKTNLPVQYAAVRNILHRKGKDIEILATYEPKLRMITEWWKQLYGESEGKDGKGIFPVNASFTTDLHSFGQMIQEGKRNLFETVVNIENPNVDIEIKADEENLDGLNYLTGKTMDYVNKMAMQGTIDAHVAGGVPNLMVSIDKLNEDNIGRLIYFFEFACGISGYTLKVNPFNQPGVEFYKRNMFKLLEKPGY